MENENLIKKDDYYTEEDVALLKSGAAELEQRVDGLLQSAGQEDYLKIFEITSDPDNSKYIKCSKKLSNLCILSVAEKKQMEKGMNVTIFTGRDLTELEALYQEIVFRLRRIEFDKDIDIKQDIFGFLSENNLTFDIVVAVLYGTAYLYDKDGIFDRIAGEMNNG